MIRGFAQKWLVVLPLVYLVVGLAAARAEGAAWSLGLSTGWAAFDEDDRNLYEVESSYGPLWVLQRPGGLRLDTRIEAGAGFIHDRRGDGWFFGAGPSWVLYVQEVAWVRLDFGSKPVAISETRFDKADNESDLDIGGHFHFLSHGGLALGHQDTLELRIMVQHISNAGIEDPNPGLDFATIGLRCRF